MRQRFEYSFAAAYLALVSLGYLTIGAFGAFWHFPPTPNLMAQFLMVDPYPLLHFAAGCTFRFPCTIFDLPYDFYGPGYPEVEFAGISQVVFSLGLLGLLATFTRNRVGLYVLCFLVSVSTVAAIWNWLALALAIREAGRSSKGIFLIPTMSIAWSLTYWVGYSRIAFRRTEKPAL